MRHRRGGFSLLEVLVACGILVVALGSIAAMLPAAGARLAEAAAQDRAAAAMAAAMAEIQARNIVTRTIVPTGTWVGGAACSPSAVVFGETLSLALISSATSAGYVTTSGSLAVTATSGNVALIGSGTLAVNALRSGTVDVLSNPTTALNSLISMDTANTTRRGFFSEDEVRYSLFGPTGLPTNSFIGGVREFNRGVCWGSMITPVGGSWSSATVAKVSVAIFRKPGNAMAMTLVSSTSGLNASTGIFITSSTRAPASLQRSLLKPCSMVLAIPPPSVGGTTPPQWLSIRSSWILTGTMATQGGNIVGVSGTNTAVLASSGTARTCVTFTSRVPQSLFSGTPATLNVIGFDNLLIVDEKVFPLP